MVKKYISFNKIMDTGKTKAWNVINITHQYILGCVRWHPTWRQYCFYPSSDTMFSSGCMQDIVDFVSDENRKHKEELRRRKEEGF